MRHQLAAAGCAGVGASLMQLPQEPAAWGQTHCTLLLYRCFTSFHQVLRPPAQLHAMRDMCTTVAVNKTHARCCVPVWPVRKLSQSPVVVQLHQLWEVVCNHLSKQHCENTDTQHADTAVQLLCCRRTPGSCARGTLQAHLHQQSPWQCSSLAW